MKELNHQKAKRQRSANVKTHDIVFEYANNFDHLELETEDERQYIDFFKNVAGHV